MRHYASVILLPLIGLVSILGMWAFAVHWWKIPSYLLPDPRSVLTVLYTGYVEGRYWEHLFFTLRCTVTGYLIGCSLAIIIGSLIGEFVVLRRLFFPFIIALQSMPKVALAPLIIVWFGFEAESKIVMVALICFFPVFINTITGLGQANAELMDLMRAFSSSRFDIFYQIKLPSAATHIFAGLQIAVVLSLIGQVVAEFVASTKGIGYLINASAVNLDTDVMFSSLLTLAAIGVVGTQLVGTLRQRLIFWDRRQANTMAEH